MLNMGRLWTCLAALSLLAGVVTGILSTGQAAQAQHSSLASLKLDRVLDSVTLIEEARSQRALIRVKGRILIGGRTREIPAGMVLKRESQLIARVNGQVVAYKTLGPFKPLSEPDEVCCWGLPPDCSEDGCKNTCTGHLGSCLCTCGGGGTTGDPDATDYTADLGPFAVSPGDHLHVSIVAASGATGELFTLNDSQWIAARGYGESTSGQSPR